MPTTYYPSRDEFRKKCEEGNLIPVWRELLADTETPVSAFYKVAYGREFGFLLESVEGGERLARYSFLGSDPFLVFRSKNDQATIDEGGKTTKVTLKAGERDPLHVLKEILGRYRYVESPALPRFVGGAVGMIGYDTVRFFEQLPDENPDELDLEDCLFMFTDALVVFDHVKHRMLALCNARVDGDPDAAYDAAIAKVDELVSRLHAPSPLRKQGSGANATQPLVSNLTQPEYEALVLRAKEYIAAGDSFQIQVARRQKKRLAADPFDVYRALRSVNPSPYMFYLVFGETKLIGASPEILVTEEEGTVCIRPLAGTRPRGASDAEDTRIAKDLLSDEKERAEHVMLVDLARNDIGRVAKFGTVRVEELMVIEKYSHVLHIVSDVKGELREDFDQFEVLRASFPAGTLTGAPKVRTMEIIEELEPARRGFYGGGIGYFSFSGNMDTAITIRTALVKGDTIYLMAAAGIVADSDPSYEYRETAHKMGALVRAVDWAEAGLE
ncbi:MAG TPA: anthranilate synthase component I [Capsulimonadaceae bacterium]|nr:anthranilate synthase component I [Capsulimonadaceae bacterium]